LLADLTAETLTVRRVRFVRGEFRPGESIARFALGG